MVLYYMSVPTLILYKRGFFYLTQPCHLFRSSNNANTGDTNTESRIGFYIWLLKLSCQNTLDNQYYLLSRNVTILLLLPNVICRE